MNSETHPPSPLTKKKLQHGFVTAALSGPVTQIVFKQKVTVLDESHSVKAEAFFYNSLAVVRQLCAPFDAAIFTAEQKMYCTRRGVHRAGSPVTEPPPPPPPPP